MSNKSNTTLSINLPATADVLEKLLPILREAGVTVQIVGAADESMSMAEAAAYLGIHYLTLRDLAVRQNAVEYYRPTGSGQGRIRFLRTVLDSYLDKKKKQAKPERRIGRPRQTASPFIW